MSDPQTPVGFVDFPIGGYQFRVHELSLLDAKRALAQIQALGSGADFIQEAEHVLDFLLVLLPDPDNKLTKDLLMMTCSLGEALQLPVLCNQLMRRSGMPQRPVQREAPPEPAVTAALVPATVVSFAAPPRPDAPPAPAADLAIPPRPVSANFPALEPEPAG